MVQPAPSFNLSFTPSIVTMINPLIAKITTVVQQVVQFFINYYQKTTASIVSFYQAQAKYYAFMKGVYAWSREKNQGIDENRAEAAERIIFAYTSKARSLNLETLWLTSLPPEIGQLVDLKDLFLRHNKLNFLPSQIGQLVQLERLFLNYNQINFLPSEIGQLVELQQLCVYDNPLTYNKNIYQFLAACPFLLQLTHARISIAGPFLNRSDSDETPLSANLSLFLHGSLNFEIICRFNGLALEFIPQNCQTEAIVDIAIGQNPASSAFARVDLINRDLT